MITVNARRRNPITIHPDQVAYLESRRVYTIVHFKNGEQYVHSKNLKVVLVDLASDKLVRIHKSFAVNTSAVREMGGGGRGAYVIMDSGVKLGVSQRKAGSVRRHFIENNLVIGA